jgi:hypothetical protein
MSPAGASHTPGPGPQRKDSTVDNTSLAHSTRTAFVDTRLCEEITELTGIEYRVLSSAFAGEEKNLALDMVKTAVAENPQGTPEEWQRFVLAWAKENGSGEYRSGYWDGYELTYEYNEFLRSIGRL